MRGARGVFGILLLIEGVKIFICNLLSGFWCAFLSLVVRRYRLLLGVE